MSEKGEGISRNSAAFCPSCERFIGPAEVCPYCDCDSAKNPMFRCLKYGAVVLAVAGLILLYLMARHSEVPEIKIAGITPMMNFGLVRIKGLVEKDAGSWKKKGQAESVSFLVDDGSGQIRVVAYGPVARALIARSLLPKRLAAVEITGSLNVSADGNSRLILRSADELRIEQNTDAGQRCAPPTGEKEQEKEN